MSDTEKGEPADELELEADTLEDLDAEDDDIRGGVAGPPARGTTGTGCP